MIATPIPDSYWVVDGLLLAGEYPGGPTKDQARAKLEAFVDAGIRAFFDLTEERELEPYEAILQEIARERQIAVTYDRGPIRDLDVPSPEQLEALLAKIADKLESKIPSYVHCWGGVGRTGTVIGCWLVDHAGLDGDRALARLAEFRSHTPKAPRRSPKTRQQCSMVQGWPKRSKGAFETGM